MLDRSRKADMRKEEKAKRPSSKKVKHGEKEKDRWRRRKSCLPLMIQE